MPEPVTHLVFDVEAVGDGDLISRVHYPHADLAPVEAVNRYRKELLEKKGSDVLPVTFVRPCAIAVAKVAADGTLLGLSSLDAPRFDPSAMVKQFWEGWKYYRRPTLVSFNGRGYDLPVLELSAYRDGLSLPEWFLDSGPSYKQPRNRYNGEAHLDLMEALSNYGAARLSGGLNLLANLLGKPGKSGMDGSQVQEYHDAGGDDEINRYCRCDVLDTYFVFLRTRVLTGRLTLEEEHDRVAAAKTWLEEHIDDPACAYYLDHWGDWQPPALD
ncbi:ribonuclease H-like domain-containing protein [Alienimonas sp. DA493]|uniref:ribonuclease H-like domain-containing protein n=1 Tax=Alienimonas sp. DA493 TaxID=3373605 RepID=UPI0037545D48